jgi:phosphoglycerate kinase
MNKMTIDDVDFKGKKALVRVDFNVPFDENMRITDDIRITASLPTINSLLQKGAALVLISHLGRPKGKVNPKYTLKPVAARLSELVTAPVRFVQDCIGSEVEQAVAGLKCGEILLLENLRFHAEEEANEAGFAQQLARLGDVFVNDAFGAAHRAHASTEGVTHFMSPSVAGLLMQKEINYLGRAIEDPQHPYLAIIGGAKISGKIDVIQNLLTKVDVLLIGGGMMYTFLKAQGREIGSSLLEEDKIDLARQLLDQASNGKCRLVLPVDTVVVKEVNNDAQSSVVPVDAIPAGMAGVDIGPATVAQFRDLVLGSKTIVWNGPMGIFEMPSFAAGTNAIAQALADATVNGAVTIVGGGDSAAAIAAVGLESRISHVSTGGGASLEFLEGKVLPGVQALSDR